MAGGGFNQNESNSEQFSGLRGTQHQDRAADRTNQAGDMAQQWTQQVMANPMLHNGMTAEQINPSGQYGLGFNADRGVQELSKQMYGQASAQGALRGRLTPEGANAAAGSALTQSLPQLIPQLQAFQQWQFQQPMNLNKYVGDMANQNLAGQGQQLGSQGKGESSGFGFGFNVAQPK